MDGGYVLMYHTCSFPSACHIDMTAHTPAFLQVEDHSMNLLYAHTSSGSETQQGMASSWVTHGNGTGQDGHPSKY